jgi:hypothetical protein
MRTHAESVGEYRERMRTYCRQLGVELNKLAGLGNWRLDTGYHDTAITTGEARLIVGEVRHGRRDNGQMFASLAFCYPLCRWTGRGYIEPNEYRTGPIHWSPKKTVRQAAREIARRLLPGTDGLLMGLRHDCAKAMNAHMKTQAAVERIVAEVKALYPRIRVEVEWCGGNGDDALASSAQIKFWPRTKAIVGPAFEVNVHGPKDISVFARWLWLPEALSLVRAGHLATKARDRSQARRREKVPVMRPPRKRK